MMLIICDVISFVILWYDIQICFIIRMPLQDHFCIFAAKLRKLSHSCMTHTVSTMKMNNYYTAQYWSLFFLAPSGVFMFEMMKWIKLGWNISLIPVQSLTIPKRIYARVRVGSEVPIISDAFSTRIHCWSRNRNANFSNSLSLRTCPGGDWHWRAY